MMESVFLVHIVLIFLARVCEGRGDYTHAWAAHIEGGEHVARSVAEKHGFTYIGKIFDDHYHLTHIDVAKRSVFPNSVHHRNLKQEPQVKWLEQQKVLKRVKRDSFDFSDPKWPQMWYLNGQSEPDMNIQGAWDAGFTGEGVVVTIVDDGLETNHPDLKTNYDAMASYDFNSHDPDPQPQYDFTNQNRHGTRCAGQVAAEADNGVCGMGVAYHTSIGGIRMLDGEITDVVESQSLSFNLQHIDIYSASWGPDDDGQTVEGPGRLTRRAFTQGILKGRGGRGSIFVWSSGNGGRAQDSCNCDGYVSSIYTLSINSVSERRHVPWYSEACSSVLASTYSSGSQAEQQAITTDLRQSCTERHTGTSASTSLAAGICALALSANPELTWRDLQHIVVRTSRSENLRANDWVSNGVGRNVSHWYGFGLMDAAAMVRLARNWTTVPEQHKCELHSRGIRYPRPIGLNDQLYINLHSNGCSGRNNEVLFVEHVQAVITLSSSYRGQIQIHLTSPQGTNSTLLRHRPRDNSREGFINWAFMTTHSWGENPEGTWTLQVVNGDRGTTTLESWSLVLYGTSTDPFPGSDPVTTDSVTQSTEREGNPIGGYFIGSVIAGASLTVVLVLVLLSIFL